MTLFSYDTWSLQDSIGSVSLLNKNPHGTVLLSRAKITGFHLLWELLTNKNDRVDSWHWEKRKRTDRKRLHNRIVRCTVPRTCAFAMQVRVGSHKRIDLQKHICYDDESER